MKLVIDSKIPFMRGFAEKLGKVHYLPGASITADDVADADALIIRTRTHCNRQLLEGSKVKFIATATIGYDHLDLDYLRQAGIDWTNCPGCNARSVAQYVESALLLLAAHGCWSPQPFLPSGKLNRQVFSKLTLGIVGVGHVGEQVRLMAERIGFGRILCCDPPRAEREGQTGFVSLAEMARQADVITFHTPLTHQPEAHPTFHLADAEFFSLIRPSAVLFNSSRGEVVDTEALKHALRSGALREAIIDTWEEEPNIDRELLSMAFLATPHIAGYSADGKANGTRMSLQAVARHFGLDPAPFAAVAPPQLPENFAYFPEGDGWKMDEALRLYDPTRDSLALKSAPETFEKLRGDYPLRREQ